MAFRLNYKGVFTGVGGPCLITPGRLTLPGMLREKGYETAMFGKWHVITAHKDGAHPSEWTGGGQANRLFPAFTGGPRGSWV